MAQANLDIRIRVKDDGSVVIDRLARKTDALGDAQDRLGRKVRGSGRAAQDADQAFGRLLFTFRNVIAGMATFYAIDRTTAAFRFLASELIEVNAEAERTQLMLSRLYGSAEAGREAFAWLVDLQSRVPFGVNAVTSAFVKFRTVGLDPAAGSLKTLLDAVAAMGGTDETVERVARGIQQMAAKGRVSMEELRQQIAEHIPGAAQTMAKELGLATDEFERRVAQGAIRSEEAIQALLRGWERDFGGATDEMAGTWTGLTNQLAAQWKIFVREVGDAGSFGRLKGALEELLGHVRALRDDGSLTQWAADVSDALWSAFESVAINSARIVDVVEPIFSWASGVVGEIWRGFETLAQRAPAVLDYGVVGVILGGKTGAKYLLGLAAITERLKTDVLFWRAHEEDLVSFGEWFTDKRTETVDQLSKLLDERGGPGTAARLMGLDWHRPEKDALTQTLEEQAKALDAAHRRAEDYEAALRNLEAYGKAISPGLQVILSEEEARRGLAAARAEVTRLQEEMESARRTLASLSYEYPVGAGASGVDTGAGAFQRRAGDTEAWMADFLGRLRTRTEAPPVTRRSGGGGPSGGPQGTPTEEAFPVTMWIDPTEGADRWGEIMARKQWEAMARVQSQLAQVREERWQEFLAAEEEWAGSYQDLTERIYEIDKENAERRKKIEQDLALERERLWRDGIGTAQGLMGEYSGLFRQLYEDSAGTQDKYWKAYKAFAIAETVTSTAAAIMRTFKDFPFPVAVGFSTAIGALGAAKVGLIASQEPARPFAEGGIFMSPFEGRITAAEPGVGPEVIAPLAELPRLLGGQAGQGGDVLQVQVNTPVRGGLDETAVRQVAALVEAAVGRAVQAHVKKNPLVIESIRNVYRGR